LEFVECLFPRTKLIKPRGIRHTGLSPQKFRVRMHSCCRLFLRLATIAELESRQNGMRFRNRARGKIISL